MSVKTETIKEVNFEVKGEDNRELRVTMRDGDIIDIKVGYPHSTTAQRVLKFALDFPTEFNELLREIAKTFPREVKQ